MNVFISWSGNRSKAVAELLDDWLQCVIQAVDPWMSSKDIDRGAMWFSEINDQLQNTTIGIICLTQDNLSKPWILFEAGALAKGLTESRVCTFLVDLEPSDIGTPLSQFNHTFPNKDGVWELIRTLNSSLKDKALKERVLEQVFDTYWPQFEQRFKSILQDYPMDHVTPKRTENEILVEILESTRSMERRVRKLEGGDFERSRPKSLVHTCSSCGSSGEGYEDIERKFGYRFLSSGQRTPQLRCKPCRNVVEGQTDMFEMFFEDNSET
ncbi:Uncharacterised protein [Vibrio vulnificus]|nr:toll/interleukin-1 receptor domain-containing protein [Vibrio vulnificus]ADV86383.1 hypothetical protein VVMO6_01361 [Vibrio vulnificus MO6-24/O]EGR0040797.1 toll/interleukin-1 receptor domain-containing protein [Vibrio vulnificus]EGR0093651.1 toll/interleukin-1 receptor domain-containing protein [Vibrio vulnificus]EGR0097881.1 toll/interleukin-1 receptor domain-containing protein [Vibrio vulnificus]EGR7945024.1 toll/interleukin-1 receptor domain-containing protein [Vibrio vulnificus]